MLSYAWRSWRLSSDCFTLPQLMWHGSSVNNGHLQGPMTLTPVAYRLAVELSLFVLTNQVCRDRGSNPDLPRKKSAEIFQSQYCIHVAVLIWIFNTKSNATLHWISTHIFTVSRVKLCIKKRPINVCKVLIIYKYMT